MTTTPHPIFSHQFPGLIGKPYWDIQGFPLESGWNAVVKGKVIESYKDLKGIPINDVPIEDFVDARGASYAKASIACKKRRRKMADVTVPKADLDYLAALLRQPSVRQAVGASTPVAAIRKALVDLVERLEKNRVVPCYTTAPNPYSSP
jgi:hypothetical protein